MAQPTLRVATVYKHIQASAAAVWTIVHNLQDYPIVDVYVSYNGDLQKILPQAVTYVDGTTVTITFSVPYSGYATVV